MLALFAAAGFVTNPRILYSTTHCSGVSSQSPFYGIIKRLLLLLLLLLEDDLLWNNFCLLLESCFPNTPTYTTSYTTIEDDVLVFEKSSPQLCLMKFSSEMLQNLAYFVYTKTQSCFFRFSFCDIFFCQWMPYFDIEQGNSLGKKYSNMKWKVERQL